MVKPVSQRQFPQHALVLVSEGQPIQELVPRHLAETPAAFGIILALAPLSPPHFFQYSTTRRHGVWAGGTSGQTDFRSQWVAASPMANGQPADTASVASSSQHFTPLS